MGVCLLNHRIINRYFAYNPSAIWSATIASNNQSAQYTITQVINWISATKTYQSDGGTTYVTVNGTQVAYSNKSTGSSGYFLSNRAVYKGDVVRIYNNNDNNRSILYVYGITEVKV